MNIKTVKHDRINEVLYTYKHESGLKAFVISKKGYSKKYAAFATHFGSINNEFIAPGEKTPVKVPDGVAHFLEHKLFEQKNGNIMDKFSQLGSMPNAYTGFNQTVYLFSCTDKFKDNFRLLLNFVQNPYITDESVEKEKGNFNIKFVHQDVFYKTLRFDSRKTLIKLLKKQVVQRSLS
jgi:predicted Zn-dependent peptidase